MNDIYSIYQWHAQHSTRYFKQKNAILGSGSFYWGFILLINNTVQSREVLISIRIQWILNMCKEVTVTWFNLLEFSAKQKNGDFSGGSIYRGKFFWLNVARATGTCFLK